MKQAVNLRFDFLYLGAVSLLPLTIFFICLHRVEDLRSPETREDLVRVTYDGKMSWTTYNMVTFSCQLNMSSFPSDEHNCTMFQAFMGDDWPFVQFSSLQVQRSPYFIENTEFHITEFEVSVCNKAHNILIVSSSGIIFKPSNASPRDFNLSTKHCMRIKTDWFIFRFCHMDRWPCWI